jgi:ABC-type amino acid transport substrate-binding protein
MVMKRIALLCLVGLLTAAVCAPMAYSAGIMDKISAQKKLKVGIAPWNNFIIWDSKSNRYKGIIADDLRKFEEITGIKAEITTTTWSGMIAGLQTGKWDAIMNGLGATIPRSMAVAFTEPYGYYCEVALIRSDDEVKSFYDLDQPGNIITVTAGTSAYELWKNKFK